MLQAAEFPTYHSIVEPKLYFGPGNDATEIDPRKGLLRFGPLDANLSLNERGNPIAVGIVSTATGVSRLLRHLGNLNTSWKKRDNDRAGTDYPGFSSIYRRPLVVPDSINSPSVRLVRADSAHKTFDGIVQAYCDAVFELVSNLPKNSPIVLHVPDEFKAFFSEVGEDGNRDLRLALKAKIIDTGVCTQLIQDKSTVANYDYCTTMWTLSLALYYKSRAVPWRIKPITEETCYVGISFGIKKAKSGQEILTGLAELFNSYGEGMTIRAIEDREFVTDRGYHLGREKMQNLLGSAITAYSEVMGRTPYRAVVHKSTPFLADELVGTREALAEIPQVDLVHMEAGPPLRLFTKGSFPPDRGTFLKLTEIRGLLYTTGYVPSFKTYPGVHIPAPLELHKYVGERPIALLANEILTLTKMNWNTSNLMCRLPVTVKYSQAIARVMKYRDVSQEKFIDFRLYI